MSDAEENLFDELGGAKVVQEVVHDMYDRIIVDPELAPFFEHASVDRIKKMQIEFVSSMVGGPVNYTGAELTSVHKGLGISRAHFSKFCGHMADAMQARGVAPRVVDQVLGRLAMYSDKVTGNSNVDG